MSDKYLGMTVLERLFVSGLIKTFDKYVREHDVYMVESILRKVNIEDEETIDAVLKQVGLKE